MSPPSELGCCHPLIYPRNSELGSRMLPSRNSDVATLCLSFFLSSLLGTRMLPPLDVATLFLSSLLGTRMLPPSDLPSELGTRNSELGTRNSELGCCHLGTRMLPPSVFLSSFLLYSELGCCHPRMLPPSEVGCCHPLIYPRKLELGCCHLGARNSELGIGEPRRCFIRRLFPQVTYERELGLVIIFPFNPIHF
jgi:hypothetical protein